MGRQHAICMRTLSGHTGWVRDVFPSFDGRYLLSSGDDMTVRLWDVSVATNTESKLTIFGREHHIECCALAPPSSYQYLAQIAGLKGPPQANSSAEFMATGSRDKIVRLAWNLPCDPDWPRQLDTGSRLPSGGVDCKLRIFTN